MAGARTALGRCGESAEAQRPVTVPRPPKEERKARKPGTRNGGAGVGWVGGADADNDGRGAACSCAVWYAGRAPAVGKRSAGHVQLVVEPTSPSLLYPPLAPLSPGAVTLPSTDNPLVD